MEAESAVVALARRDRGVTNREVVARLRVSPATAHRLLARLVAAGVLARAGRGRAVAYRLRELRRRFALAGLAEDRVWAEIEREATRRFPLPDAARRTLAYAVTEMVNNAIDHSGGRRVLVGLRASRDGVTVVVEDDGVGVFAKLGAQLGTTAPAEVVVRLEKGKVTTDPEHHTGEGIFFTSKAVSRFTLESDGLAWVVDNIVSDVAIGPSAVRVGTRVTLEVFPGKVPVLEDVFRRYTDPDTLRFDRTRTTVKLARLGTSLISRSEAKRVVDGLERFTGVTLDFQGVDLVGQGFCDEVFRVFARAHPGVALVPVNMRDPVAFMVRRACTPA